MCGRYYVDDETAREIERLVKEVDAKLSQERKKRDVHPTEAAPVIRRLQAYEISSERGNLPGDVISLPIDSNKEDKAASTDDLDQLGIRYQYWGFPTPKSKSDERSGNGVVFNARVESAIDKPMFADSLRNRRIIVPARGFYEWGPDKTKYGFVPSDGKLLYMAGIYRRYEEKERFVILTTEANDLMRPIHDRMPLLLKQDQIEEWILESRSTAKLLKESKVSLEKQTDFEQLSLFD